MNSWPPFAALWSWRTLQRLFGAKPWAWLAARRMSEVEIAKVGSREKTPEWGLGVVSGKSTADVFVVGGGPAGLAAAIAAGQTGMYRTGADGTGPPVGNSAG